MAVPLPEHCAAEVTKYLDPFRSRHPRARWIAAESLHLTLLFLGSTRQDAAPALGTALLSVAAAHSPFELTLGRGGGRARGDGDGVCWLEIGSGADDVLRLRRELADTTGHEPAHSGRGAHMTVARQATRELIAELSTTAPVRLVWQVDRIVLFQSHLGGEAARYEEVAAAELAG